MPSNNFMPIADGCRPTIDIVHKHVHDGKYFSAGCFAVLAAASALNVLVTAPDDGREYHVIAEIAVDAAAVATFCINPNATATGATAITAYNHKFESSNVSTLSHVYGGAYTSSGSVVETFIMGSSSGNGANRIVIGGSGVSRDEFIPAPNGKYLIRVVAGAATCQTAIRMHYYYVEE